MMEETKDVNKIETSNERISTQLGDGIRKILKDGKWQPGKASPWLPPEHMRGLPKHWTTRNTSDNDRIHELDAPHTVEELKEEWVKKDSGLNEEKKSDLKDVYKGKPGDHIRLSQQEIDFVRTRILFVRVKAAIDMAMRMVENGADGYLKMLLDFPVGHVWFPEDDIDKYELRTGNPPADCDRPKHLRNFHLEIDIHSFPDSVLRICRERGVDMPNFKQALLEQERKHVI